MIRAETLAAIRKGLEDRRGFEFGRTHFDGCAIDWTHRDCTIAWLLQEIEYLNAQLAVSRDVRAVIAAELALQQAEVSRLRDEMARLDRHIVTTYLAGKRG